MRVLSWDVGLRTLSYCMLQVELIVDKQTGEATHVPTVEAWESIDVLAEFRAATAEPCQDETTTGRKRKATTTVSKMTLEESVRAVIGSLTTRMALVTPMPDAITIEQQPAGGHNRFSSVNMKVISHVMQGFFFNLLGDQCTITFVSPASKLTEMRAQEKEEKKKKAMVVVAGEFESIPAVSTTSAGTEEAGGVSEREEESSRKAMGQRYRKNKQFAVHKTHELLLLTSDIRALKILDDAGKKKDDLCDAFLLGYYYAVKNLKLPIKKRVTTKKNVAVATNVVAVE